MEMADRQFRTSHIAPYSANVAFVLYACDDDNDADNDKRAFMLQLFVNEKPVMIPGCEDLLCTYQNVRQKYSRLIETCDIANICFSGTVSNFERASLVVYIATVFLSYIL